MEKDKDTFTLRIPTETNKSIKKLSQKTGLSQNSLILLFIDMGMKSYSDLINHQKEEFCRFVSHNRR